MSTTTTSLRVLVHGTVIDVKSREGGVINLVVRAHQQHTGLVGRLRQYLAHALFRAGDLCHPGNNHHAVRVVQRPVAAHAVDDGLPHSGHADLAEITPLHTTNGDAHYQALVIYEGVKQHGDRLFPFHEVTSLGRQKSADDVHGQLQKVDWDAAWPDQRRFFILPDQEGGAA